MQTRARLYSIDTFGKEHQHKKAVFIDLETWDKVGVMISDEEKASLAPSVGKDGILSVALISKGYDYSAKFHGFKVIA